MVCPVTSVIGSGVAVGSGVGLGGGRSGKGIGVGVGGAGPAGAADSSVTAGPTLSDWLSPALLSLSF